MYSYRITISTSTRLHRVISVITYSGAHIDAFSHTPCFTLPSPSTLLISLRPIAGGSRRFTAVGSSQINCPPETVARTTEYRATNPPKTKPTKQAMSALHCQKLMNATLNLPSAESPLTPSFRQTHTRHDKLRDERTGEKELSAVEAHPKTAALPFRNRRKSLTNNLVVRSCMYSYNPLTNSPARRGRKLPFS